MIEEKEASERQERRPLQDDAEQPEHTKHAGLTRETAWRQRRLSMVEVMRADIISQVGGATGHPKGRGTEETRTE